MTPDLAARKAIAAAYAYYVLDETIISDDEYDSLINFACDNWNQLSQHSKDVMVDPESARSTGHHFRFNRRVQAATQAWISATKGKANG